MAALCVGADARAQRNASFESGGADALTGWSLYRPDDPLRGVAVAVDTTVAAAGARSLKIEQQSATGFTRVAQRLRYRELVPASDATAVPARRLRLRAALRAGGAATVGLWLRVAGAKGALYLDSRGDGREGAGGAETALDAAASTAEWMREELELPLPTDADEVAFGALLRGQGTGWFDDFSLEVIDVAARPPPTATATRYLDDALAVLERNSINGPSLDWRDLRTAAGRQARGADAPSGVYPALRYAIYELGDRHSYLLAPRAQAALDRAPVSNARTGRAAVLPRAERLARAYGYVAVPGFAGGSAQAQVEFAEQVQASIENVDLSGTCGWILDLRLNNGGNLWPMLAGVGPLLGEGEAGASLYPDGRRTSIWYRDGQAGFGDYAQLRVREPYRPAAPPPVAVLLGPGTASSAEVLAVAFRGRARTLSFGAPTSGLSAGNRTFVLADGAALVLTVAATADRAGRVYADAIEPERPVQAEREAGAAMLDDLQVRAAADWLATQASCRDAAN